MEDHEVIKTFKCPREEKDKKYHALGVIMKKHFTMLNKKHDGIDESKLPKELEI